MNGGKVHIGGFFDKGQVTGKGFKKWHNDNGIYIYRGNLVESQISGYGVFKWPDGRHYIGDFVNAQMHGHGKLSWTE